MDAAACYGDYKVPRRSRRFERESFRCDNYAIFNPDKYPTVMHVSDLLKNFRRGNQEDTVSNQSSRSAPSSSRHSFALSPRVSNLSRRSGGGGSGNLNRQFREHYSIQSDVRTQEQWDELLARDGLIVVDAYTTWCGPCKSIISTFRRLKNELSSDRSCHFAIASTEKIESLSLYRGKSRPTFLLYGGGELVYVVRGCNAPLLIQLITYHIENEHKIQEGDAERKQFIDTEVEQKVVKEEKKDVEKKKPEEEEEEEIVEVDKEVTVAIIKPDAVKAGIVDDILKRVEEAGIEILQKEERTLTKEEAAEFYKQHEGSEHFEQLIEFMSSGPCTTLLLSKKGDGAGYGVIPEFRDLLGPKDVNQAKEEAPASLRAQYGTDAVMNAVHGCDSSESAARELAFFFPNFNIPKVQEKRKKKQIQRTLALIRPHALEKRRESILKKIEESGFVIAMSKEMHLTKEQAEDFYSDHKDKEYFESLIHNMTCGPSLALCLAREDAVESWRNMLGPKDVAVAKEQAPDSLRAVFADEESDINPLHGADSVTVADAEIKQIFPPQSTVAVIKPEVYSVPEQREQIISKIKESGFQISLQKEINLTKELAAQFYKEHEGKEFYDGLTDYMSSGPTLFMILSREDAVSGFRSLMGPVQPEEAKDVAPDSLRAQFASDGMKNAIHGSSSVTKARAIIEEYFPEAELNSDGTVKDPTVEEPQEEPPAGEDKDAVEEEPIAPSDEGKLYQQREDDVSTDANNNLTEDGTKEEVTQDGSTDQVKAEGESQDEDSKATENAPVENETAVDAENEIPKSEGNEGQVENASNEENNANESTAEGNVTEPNAENTEESETANDNIEQEAMSTSENNIEENNQETTKNTTDGTEASGDHASANETEETSKNDGEEEAKPKEGEDSQPEGV